MGYFSNGAEGQDYEERHCSRCLHDQDDNGCAVWLAHLLANYEECNNEESPLHVLIPRGDGGLYNKKCRMFIKK